MKSEKHELRPTNQSPVGPVLKWLHDEENILITILTWPRIVLKILFFGLGLGSTAGGFTFGYVACETLGIAGTFYGWYDVAINGSVAGGIFFGMLGLICYLLAVVIVMMFRNRARKR